MQYFNLGIALFVPADHNVILTNLPVNCVRSYELIGSFFFSLQDHWYEVRM